MNSKCEVFIFKQSSLIELDCGRVIGRDENRLWEDRLLVL